MLFKLTSFLVIALNLFECEAAFSKNLLPQVSQNLQVSKSEFTNLACFMKTTNGTVLDLSNLCVRQPTNLQKIKSIRTLKQYNYKKIQDFNNKVYGD